MVRLARRGRVTSRSMPGFGEVRAALRLGYQTVYSVHIMDTHCGRMKYHNGCRRRRVGPGCTI